MAKNTKKENKQDNAARVEVGNQPAPQRAKHQYSLFDFRTQAIILAILSFVFYANTISNTYALDDMLVIVDNAYVQRGVAGIGDILTHDAYHSYMERRNGGNALAGGRYRPLSIITFAIEQQILGVTVDPTENVNVAADRTPELELTLQKDMHVRHFINVLLYTLLVIVLLRFLRQVIFPNDPLLAFMAVVLFTIHPLHTEVVANVKSRDEILSLLFISLTFIKAFKYRASNRTADLVWGCVFFLLALLSKEYAATLLVLLPLSFYMFGKDTPVKSLKGLLPYLAPFAVYMILRLLSGSEAMEGSERTIMNEPYLYASATQKVATIIMVLLNYIKLLIVPYPLISDYSFNQIPYTTLANPVVWLSLIVHVGMIIAAGWFILKRHFLGFALAFYLLNLALIGNIFFNVGAPMGERLIFHSSVGFAILMGWLLYKLYEKGAPSIKAISGAIMAVLVLLCGYTTIARNPYWKNNTTLFLKDVQVAPNSALVNTNAGAACMILALHEDKDNKPADWLNKAIGFYTRTIAINPKHYFAYLNRGLCEFNLGRQALAVSDWDTVRKYAPQTANLDRYLDIAGRYFNEFGSKCLGENKKDSATFAFNKGVIAAPKSGEMWYKLGLACYQNGNYSEAIKALTQARQLMPQNTDVLRLYESATALAKGDAVAKGVVK